MTIATRFSLETSAATSYPDRPNISEIALFWAVVTSERLRILS